MLPRATSVSLPVIHVDYTEPFHYSLEKGGLVRLFKLSAGLGLVLSLVATPITPAGAKEQRYALNAFSTSKSKVLNANQRSQVTGLVTGSMHRAAKQIRCVGFYHSIFGVTGMKLASDRAVAACGFAKKVRPELNTLVQLQMTSQRAVHARVSLLLELPKDGEVDPAPSVPIPSPVLTPTTKSAQALPASTVSLRDWASPSIFDLNVDKVLKFNLSLDSDGFIDTPKIWATFEEPYTSWEIPAQFATIQASVSPVSVSDSRKVFQVVLPVDARQAIGTWKWNIAPITAMGNEIGVLALSVKNSTFEFKRSSFGSETAKSIVVGSAISYESFKSERHQLFPWEGRNVVLLIKTTTLSPAVMGRILFSLDKAFDSYESITQYSPSKARVHNNKLSIAVLASNDVGCGAACGYLGATGIEISQPLFNRLYNGVERFDQYDQALFYELGRNFWDYAGFQKVLTVGGRGTWDSDPFWDVSTTGFACYMRAVTVELNQIPMLPWDGDNKSWQSFLAETRRLVTLHAASSTSNFGNTFQAKKPPYTGKLGATDFWASVMLYFSEGKDAVAFNRTFFQTLKAQRTPSSTAEVVQNFVKALSAASGKDISSVFFDELKFGDSLSLK